MQILKRRSDAIYLTEMGAFIARRINITPQTTTAAGMNSLINAKPVKKHDEQTRKADSRDPEEMLMAFTSAAMNYSTVSELDKAYKYIAQKLSDDDELLAKATDVYSVRREELNETSM